MHARWSLLKLHQDLRCKLLSILKAFQYQFGRLKRLTPIWSNLCRKNWEKKFSRCKLLNSIYDKVFPALPNYSTGTKLTQIWSNFSYLKDSFPLNPNKLRVLLFWQNFKWGLLDSKVGITLKCTTFFLFLHGKKLLYLSQFWYLIF